MAAADELELTRTFPARALRRLTLFVLVSGLVLAVSWILFGTEPERLPSGEANPLVMVPLATTLLVAALGLPFVLALARRPLVIADHYAVTVRAGAGRTLVLPWAGVAEIAGRAVRGDPLLLVRCTGHRGQYGDRPRWYDQAVLRAAIRAAGPRRAEVGAYDLAVRLDEFSGRPAAQLAALAAWTPPHVLIIDEL